VLLSSASAKSFYRKFKEPPKGASAQENICLKNQSFVHLLFCSRLKYTQVFLRVCAAHMLQKYRFSGAEQFCQSKFELELHKKFPSYWVCMGEIFLCVL